MYISILSLASCSYIILPHFLFAIIDMNHDGHSKGVSNTPRLKSPSEDMLTTDSGIGTTAPRSQYKEADRNYVHGSRRSKEMPKVCAATSSLYNSSHISFYTYKEFAFEANDPCCCSYK